MQEDRNEQAIRDFTRIFKNEHNVDGVEHLFDTKNFIHHFRALLSPGFEGLKQVGRMMNGAFPGVAVTEEDLISSGDRVVERSLAIATHKGSMKREEPTGKTVSFARKVEKSTSSGGDRTDGAFAANWGSATARLTIPTGDPRPCRNR